MQADSPSWRIHGMPAPLTAEVYARGRDSLVRYYRRVPGVSGVYFFGQVSRPGLSDLDAIVAMRDDARHGFGAQYDTRAFAPSVRRAVIHPPQFVPESLWPSLPLLWNVTGLERAWGRALPAPELSPARADELEILETCALLIRTIPTTLIRAALRGRCHARHTQSKLHLLARYAGRVAAMSGAAVDGADDLLADVAQLRDQWFQRPAAETCRRLGELVFRSLPVIESLAEVLARFLPEAFGAPVGDLGAGVLAVGSGARRVEIRFEPGQPRCRWEQAPDGHLVVRYPAALALPVAAAAGVGGPLGEYLARTFQGQPLLPQAGVRDVVFEAARAKGEHGRFLVLARLPVDKTLYYWYAPPDRRGSLERAWVRSANAVRALLPWRR